MVNSALLYYLYIMKIKKNYIGSTFFLKGKFRGVIIDTPKTIKLYKKLGLPIFEDKPVKNATKKESSK